MKSQEKVVQLLLEASHASCSEDFVELAMRALRSAVNDLFRLDNGKAALYGLVTQDMEVPRKYGRTAASAALLAAYLARIVVLMRRCHELEEEVINLRSQQGDVKF